MPMRRPDDSANQLPGRDPGFAARDRSGGTPLSPNSSPCKRSTPLGSTACRKQPAARQPPKHCKRSSISISTNSASSSRHAALAETEPVSCQRLGGQPHPPALTLDPETRPVTSPQRPAGRPHPGRFQIGMVAAFKSERVAAFKSEYPAGFIGIRIRSLYGHSDEYSVFRSLRNYNRGVVLRASTTGGTEELHKDCRNPV